MFIDREIKEPGTPLGVRYPLAGSSEKKANVLSASFKNGHCTPKGVRNFRTLESYKYRTPPE